MFDQIIGNDKAKAYLRRTAERGTIGNSLLFAGPEGIGKSLFAEAFARMLICQDDAQGIHKIKLEAGNHPDIRIYRPEGKIAMHSIGSMRQFSEEVYLAPAESRWKVFIIHDADRMLPYSANALLKTFEEPSADTVIILLTSSPESLLPTVLSRCRTVYFHPIEEHLIASYVAEKCGKTNEEAKQIAAQAHGSIGHAMRLAQSGENPLRDILLSILNERSFRSYNDLSAAASSLADAVEADKKDIEAEVRASLLAGAGENLNATQKQGIEKEIEGAVAIHATQEANALFDVILGWYRDIHLLRSSASPTYLIHRDLESHYQKSLTLPNFPSIEEVQKHINSARLSIDRSTSIQITLENLFLQLNLL